MKVQGVLLPHDRCGIVFSNLANRDDYWQEIGDWLEAENIPCWQTVPYALFNDPEALTPLPVGFHLQTRHCGGSLLRGEYLSFITTHYGGVRVALRWADNFITEDLLNIAAKRKPR